jgi:hypothetical protein
MAERSRYAPWLGLGLIALLVVVGIVSFRRSVTLKYDFHHFYLDAAFVWQHGELNPDLSDPDPSRRRQMPFYLPVVALLLSPLTAWGAKPAAALWTIGHILALAYSLNVLRRWRSPTPSRAPPGVALALACVLTLPAVFEVARFNQISFCILALTLGGLTALERDKPGRAGVLLGLATVFKLLPAVFAVWLVLKRKGAALVMWLATVLAVSLLPCLLVFGTDKTIAYHRQWWSYNVGGAAARGMADPGLREHFVDYRNQSIPAVLARLFWPEHPYPAPFQPTALSPRSTTAIAWCVTAALAAALLWLTRRRLPADDVSGFRTEAAAYALAMLVFAPLLRQYYLIWALPALVLLAQYALDPAAGRLKRLGQVGVGIWLLGMLAWLAPAARACGAHLVMSIALGGLLLGAARLRHGRGPLASGCSPRHRRGSRFARLIRGLWLRACGKRCTRCARRSRTSCSWSCEPGRRGQYAARSPDRTPDRDCPD